MASGKGEKMRVQPLTLSAEELIHFLNSIQAIKGDESEVDTYGACETAMEKMDWIPNARKVVMLVGDSPPHKETLGPLLAMIHKFKENKGTFDTVLFAEEHERFDGELKRYRQTQADYQVLATAGGGTMKSLTEGAKIDQQVLISPSANNGVRMSPRSSGPRRRRPINIYDPPIV